MSKRIAYTTLLFLLLLGNKIQSQDLFKRVIFSPKDQASMLLSEEDSFTKSWSQFDIESRMNKKGSTKAELMDLISKQVLEWEAHEIEKISNILLELDLKIKQLNLKLDYPNEINFVKTTGKEEGGALAYTRSNYIVFGQELMNSTHEDMMFLILHELFHVLSRHNNAFRKSMYGIIGFKIGNSIDYPEGLKTLKITNPDATQTDASILLEFDGTNKPCLMVLYAKEAYSKGSFFDYLKIGFLELTGDQELKPLYVDGAPVIHNFEGQADFFKQVGNNTNYIIHPEEIMAENFSYTVMEKKDLKSPWVTEQILSVLQN
jgi:hypothetical protein